MTELVIERILPAPVQQVFDFITQRDNLLKWWGPEGMSLPDDNLDFTKLGPWHSVMMNAEGKRFKVSGQVTKVNPPNLVAFTWGWHNEEDKRQNESHVMLKVEEAEEGKARLLLTHTDLPDEESRENHKMGWTSSLRKLERHFGALQD